MIMTKKYNNGILRLCTLILCCCISFQLSAFDINRVEPLCWWTDMQTNLQLMIYGQDIAGSTVAVEQKGLTVKKVHNAESPNYLFVDVDVKKAGTYTLILKKGKQTASVHYTIYPRPQGSKDRVGFNTSDVIYLLMPDRFANGDEGNDNMTTDTSLINRNGIDTRHGGDIQGIIDHLDYLANLGITTIWPTPILEDNSSYHQYACSDYYKVDPHFGTNQLYQKMVEEAHLKGLKIIQDVVPNHCGAGHWWMKDLPFKDWINQFDTFTKSNYALQVFSDPYAAPEDKLLCKRGWFVESLPDMNLENPYVMQYMIQMAIWWIEFANLDGLRVDTYFYMGEEAATWTKGVRDEYPNLAIVGEVWGNDTPIINYWLENKDEKAPFNSHLPMAMDFPLQRSLVMGISHDNEAWGGGLKSIYNLISQDFVYDDANRSMVVFADNHDTERIYNMLGKDLNKTMMALTLICTTRGTPQIYYGTELIFENDSRGGPHQGRPDFLGGWKEDHTNLFDEANRSPEQKRMFNHLRTLLRYRKDNPTLHDGKLMHFVPEGNVYTYFRYDDNKCIMVIINASKEEKTIDWKRFEDILTDKKTGTGIFTNKKINRLQETKISPESSMIIEFMN